MKPLSVGNVVSAGLRIYRDNFKKYYRLAFVAALWSWIPIYGWAKFYFIQGLISRLAYSEIIEKEETIQEAQRSIKGHWWSFLGAALLVSLRLLLAYIVGVFLLFVLVGIVVVGSRIILPEAISYTLAILVGTIGLCIFLGYLVRLISSYFVSELFLSVEDNINASKALKRSQELSQGNIVNLVIIVLISSLISFPLWGLILAIQLLPEFLPSSDSASLASIFTVVQLIFNSVTSALIIPFWQSVKAFVYYDLRVRREGMGIDLRK
jgi:hypothetical protein